MVLLLHSSLPKTLLDVHVHQTTHSQHLHAILSLLPSAYFKAFAMQRYLIQVLAAWQQTWTILSQARDLLSHAAAQSSAEATHEACMMKTAEDTVMRTDKIIVTDTVMKPVGGCAQEPMVLTRPQ